ncbi:MAG: cysteine desulfurase family protein [Patescibacteria group bacterium]|nr:cysteine desulfurase family protein [Patescibacteria group bacterium]
MRNRIYLDYASTTPIDPKVLEEMLPYLKDDFGNPSSIHRFGQRAQMACDKARERVSCFLNCSSSEIVFTGSATEANNLAIFGIVKAAQKRGVERPHIITTQIEHHAVLEPCRQLEKEGVEVTYLPVGKEGIVKVCDVEKAIKENTVLVSIMYANNEIGTVQPIAEIANVIRNFRNPKSEIPISKPRLRRGSSIISGQIQNSKFKIPIFHTDAVQAVNYLNCDVQKLAVDLLTLSGHKIYGPKGVGALYIRQGTLIEPLIYGGGQEERLRSGTENVTAIVGLAAAIAEIKNQKGTNSFWKRAKIKNLRKLRNKLIEGILKSIPGAKLNGSLKYRLPNNANFTIPGAEGESMVIALDQEGVACATGSACSSRSLEPSHVLLSLGLSSEQAHSSLRLTLGRYTTEKEIDYLLEVLPKIVKRLRKISGYKIRL